MVSIEKPSESFICSLNIQNSLEIGQIVLDYFGKHVLVRGNKPMVLTSRNAISYLAYKESKKTPGKKQKLIDELTSYEAPYINYKKSSYTVPSCFSFNHNDGINPVYVSSAKSTIVYAKSDAQILPNGWLLLRGYYEFVTSTQEGVENEIIDAIRFYYKDGELIKARRSVDGSYITAQGISSQHSEYNMEIDNISNEVFEQTKLKYMKNIIEDMPVKNRINFVYNLLTVPTIEQIYKEGYTEIVEVIAESNRPVNKLLKTYFGKDANPKASFPSKYNINKYQNQRVLKLIQDTTENNFDSYKSRKALTMIKMLRDMYDELYSLDNKTFDMLFNFIEENMCNYNIINCLEILTKNRGIPAGIELLNKLLEFSDNYDSKNENGYTIRIYTASYYYDICRMAEKIQCYMGILQNVYDTYK